MTQSKPKPIAAALLIGLIIAVIVVGLVLSRKPRHRERQEYDYTIYGIADDGTVYVWTGHTPKWPITYKGKELHPLYACENGHTFAGQDVGITAECPVCHTRNVGSYDKDSNGPIDAQQIKVRSPD